MIYSWDRYTWNVDLTYGPRCEVLCPTSLLRVDLKWASQPHNYHLKKILQIPKQCLMPKYPFKLDSKSISHVKSFTKFQKPRCPICEAIIIHVHYVMRLKRTLKNTHVDVIEVIRLLLAFFVVCSKGEIVYFAARSDVHTLRSYSALHCSANILKILRIK